jgi:inner membrane protein
MSPVTHFFVGWAVANSVPSLEKRDRAWITLASVVPDIDGLGLIAEILTRNSAKPLTWWSDYHHILGHNIGFAALFTALAYAFARRKLLTSILVFISFHLHLFCDLIGARGPDGDQWPIPYLRPFSTTAEWTWAGQWALNSWQNLLLTASLIALACFLAIKRGYSPVEIFSRKGDAAVVKALRQRK